MRASTRRKFVAGAAGRAMMCSSAAVQVSLDAGTREGGVQSATARWQRAHAVGPALVAAFACSPLLLGEPTGWRSTRQRFWRDIDPSRTRPPEPRHDPVTALTDLALGAQLMTVRDAEGTCRPAPCGRAPGGGGQRMATIEPVPVGLPSASVGASVPA